MIAINAVAEAYGITDAIRGEWEISRPDFVERSRIAARSTSLKAWRFEGEMHEIAATFDAVGLPAEFHRAAAEIYRRMARFKDSDPPPDLDTVISAVLDT
jgi:hypothetical protein